MEENKTIEKKQDNGIGEIFYGLFLFVIAYLLFMPEMFDFSSAPWYGKCLMILGTTVFSAFIIFVIIVIEKEKIFGESKKRFVGYFLFFALIAFNICSYFDENVWGIKPIVIAMIFIAIMFFAIYFKLKQLLQKKMNNESNPLVLIALAILFVVISLILEWGGNVEYANVLLKVSVGFVYLVDVGIFMYFCIYKPANRTGKEIETIIWIVFIGALILITFPFYIKWCGISSCDFDTFVTVYAALVGGGITLGGVAWTIKKSDKDRKEENRGKARPFFGIIDTDNYKSEVSQRLGIGFRPKEFNKLNYYKEINIENSDKVPFFIEKFVIGEREYYPDSTLLISKGMICALVIYEEDDKKTNINKFYLYLTDINYEQRKYEIEDLGSYRYTIKEI